MSKLFTRASVQTTTWSGASLKGALGTLWDALNSRGFSDVARTTVTSSGTLTTTQCGILTVDCTSGSIVLTAPVSGTSTDDAKFEIRRIDSDYTKTLTFIPNGATDTVEGVTGANGGAVTIFPQGAADVQLPGGSSNWRCLKLSGATAQAARDMAGVGTLSYRNKVRNPKGEIAQRGTSIASLGAVSQYTLDGWKWDAASITGVVTVAQGAGLASTECQTSIQATVTTADASVTAAKVAQLLQPIEGYLVRDLIGNPIGIRFEAKSPKSGLHYVALRNSGLDRSAVLPYTLTAANTAQQVYVAFPTGLITAGTWNWTTGVGTYLSFPLMAGSTFQTSTLNAWQTGNFIAGTGQQNLLDTIGNVFAVTGVQLEKAVGQPPLEHRDPNTEAELNYRYYWAPGSQYNVAAYAPGANVTYHAVGFPAAMRTTPTVSITWSSLVNAAAGSSRAVGTTGAESSLAISVAPNWFSGVVTYNNFSAEL